MASQAHQAILKQTILETVADELISVNQIIHAADQTYRSSCSAPASVAAHSDRPLVWNVCSLGLPLIAACRLSTPFRP